MQIGKTLYFIDRKDWRRWLQENYCKEKEVWLIYPKKASGKPRIPYNDAVEEALCFGWIDSTAKRLDENSFAQRFSPRNPKTPYSETNKQRLRRMLMEGKVIPSVEAAVKDFIDEDFVVPSDILDAIKSSKGAYENFEGFSLSYKRIRVGYIEAARGRPAEFQKRLRHFIDATAKNKQFGYGGVQTYY